MAKQTGSRQLLKIKADTLTESEAAEVLEYIGIMQSLHTRMACPDGSDEALFRLLSAALRVATTKKPGGSFASHSPT